SSDVCSSDLNWAWGDSRWNNVVSPNGMPSTSNNGLEVGNGIMFRSMGTTYGGFMKKYTLLSVRDGTSNTFMIGESLPQRCQWTGAWAYANNVTGTCAIYPNATTTTGAFFSAGDWPNCYSFHSAHTGGVQFALMDGSVRFVSNSVDIPTYRAMATLTG